MGKIKTDMKPTSVDCKVFRTCHLMLGVQISGSALMLELNCYNIGSIYIRVTDFLNLR